LPVFKIQVILFGTTWPFIIRNLNYIDLCGSNPSHHLAIVLNKKIFEHFKVSIIKYPDKEIMETQAEDIFTDWKLSIFNVYAPLQDIPKQKYMNELKPFSIEVILLMW
jgi:hypothetical protein